MSTVYLALLLLAAVAAGATGVGVLRALRGLRAQVVELRAELAAGLVPGARTPAHCEEIRAAVAAALADERERELAEARTFWAVQEARESSDGVLFEPADEEGGEPVYLPRQLDTATGEQQRPVPLPAEAVGSSEQQFAEALREALDELVHEETTQAVHEDRGDAGREGADRAGAQEPPSAGDAGLSPRPAVPDMRRHPSHPDFTPARSVADPARTAQRLAALAEQGVPLSDVRPGPLGTLDVYVFGDGSSLVVTPGNRAAAERLTAALRSGRTTLLLGGSGVGGAYALTFSAGDEPVYVLADRVVASL